MSVIAASDPDGGCADNDTGNVNDFHWKSKFPHVGKEFFVAADLSKLDTFVVQFHASQVVDPFIVERAVLPTTMNDPKSGPVKSNSMSL